MEVGGGGGGRKCPRWLWTLITFLLLKQTQPNLANFPKIYLATIWYYTSWSNQFDVSMATVFWQACFSKFWFSCIFNQNFPVFFAIFTYLYHSGQFWPFWRPLEKSRNPRWRTKMAAAQKWWRNSHVMWRYQLILRTSKETVFDVLFTH